MFNYLLSLLFLCTFILGYGQPIADFSASQRQGCGSLEVQFTDLSTPNGSPIVSWEWELGGVNASTPSPGRIFNQPGLYDICLSVTDQSGQSDQLCRPQYIEVFRLPQAFFTIDNTTGCTPFEARFSDASTQGDAPIIEWIWGVGGDCGAVVNNTNEDLTCTYSLAGTYSVSLAIRDSNGCISTTTSPGLLTVADPPLVAFEADSTFSCNPPLIATFTNQSQNNGNTSSYIWDFGNGTFFQGQSPPPVEYDQSGNYSVTLIATDSSTGCTGELTIEDYISVGSLADFSFNIDQVCLGEPVNYANTPSQQPDSSIWDVGYAGLQFRNRDSLQFLYPEPGCYTVQLQRFYDGCVQTGVYDCIEVLAPVNIDIQASDTAFCQIPQAIEFTLTGDIAAVDTFIWYFDFGEDTITTDPSASFTATKHKTYFVNVTTVDTAGCKINSEIQRIQAVPLIADIEGLSIQGCAPLEVDMRPDILTTSPLTSIEWLVDGPVMTILSRDSTFNFILSDTGRYDVVLTVTNEEGCSDTLRIPDYIWVGEKPIADFAIDPDTSCIKDFISFLDLSSSFADEWFWDFEANGSIDDMAKNPMHQYQEFGTYDVSLVVGHNGCYDTLFKPSVVTILPPEAAFNDIHNCDNPLEVRFENTSLKANRYMWDFGVAGTNADTSTAIEPVFTYPEVGTYAVTLTAYNDTTGCEHTETINVLVLNAVAGFELDTLQGCVPLLLAVENSSSSVDAYTWVAPGAVQSGQAATPFFTYDSAGVFSAPTLIVSNRYGCQDTFVGIGNIRANSHSLSLDPAGINGGCIPFSQDFFATTSSTFANAPMTYNWFLDSVQLFNQTTAAARIAIDTPAVTQLYIKAADSWGCVAEVTRTLFTTDTVIDFEADSLGCPNVAHVFRFVGDLETGLLLEWDYGDASPVGQGTISSHVYTASGLYTVCLRARDTLSGCQLSKCKVINIQEPVAGFTADTSNATCPPLLVNFSNTSRFANHFLWDFGDNSGVSALDSPSHLYTQPGVYTIRLIAIRSDVCLDTVTITDAIRIDGPSGTFDLSLSDNCLPVVATLEGTSMDSLLYLWDYGDGSPLDSNVNVTNATRTHTYTQTGTYFPSLSIIDTQQCKITLLPPFPILVLDASAGFDQSDSIGCSTATITFTDTSSGTDSLTFRQWIFAGGNPAVSTNQTENVTYNSPGSYDVILIIGSEDCLDTLVKPDAVFIARPPQADFSVDPDPICIPQQLILTDLSLPVDGSITSRQWSTSNAQNGTGTVFSFPVTDTAVFSATLLVQNSFGCIDSITKEIFPRARPRFQLPKPELICIGNSVGLQAIVEGDTNGLIYSWRTEPSLSCLNCPNPIASPQVSTTYELTITDQAGCSATQSVTVEVSPFEAPDIQLTSDTSICPEQAILLTASGGSSVYDYQWDSTRLGLSCYANCFNPVATPSKTTTYVVTVSNDFNCKSTDSVTIRLLLPDTAIAGADQSICQGQEAQLQIVAGMIEEPSWSPVTDLSCASCANPIAKPKVTTTYFLEARSTDFGCRWRDSVTVFVIDPAIIDAGKDTAVCRGQAVQLNATGSGLVSWSPDSLFTDPNSLRTTATVNENTTFILQVDVGPCILRDSVSVTLLDKLIIENIDTLLCAGETINLSPISSAQNYRWLPTSQFENPIQKVQTITANENATYQVIVSQEGCMADTGTVQIRVNLLPNIELPSIHYFLPSEQEVRLPLTVLGLTTDYQFTWLPSDGLVCDNCPFPTAVASDGMRYRVIVTDTATSCQATEEVQLRLLRQCPESLIQFPNILSPNEDGINDVFSFYINPVIQNVLSLSIYDRWGERLFFTEDLNKNWDGRFRGEYVDAGVYVYMLSALCPLTNEIMLWKGSVTVVR